LQVFINNRRFWSNSREFLTLSFFLGLVMQLGLHRNVLDFAGEGIEIWWWCLRMERWSYFYFILHFYLIIFLIFFNIFSFKLFLIFLNDLNIYIILIYIFKKKTLKNNLCYNHKDALIGQQWHVFWGYIYIYIWMNKRKNKRKKRGH